MQLSCSQTWTIENGTFQFHLSWLLPDSAHLLDAVAGFNVSVHLTTAEDSPLVIDYFTNVRNRTPKETLWIVVIVYCCYCELLLLFIVGLLATERDTYSGNTIENRGCLFIYIYVWTYVCYFVL